MSLQAERLLVNGNQLETSPVQLPEIGDHEVRIQVLFSAVSRNDVLQLEGSHASDYFGAAAVGKVVAIGKEVGTRKVGEVVGVFRDNINRGAQSSGFTTYLQVDVGQVVFLPVSITPQQASSLLSEGIVAYNALEKLPHGSTIAVIGINNLAYLTVQFAKRVFGLKTTVFSQDSIEGVAEAFGADAADSYSAANIKKYEEKFDAVVVTEPIPTGAEKSLQGLAIRTGKVLFTTQFSYTPAIVFFDLIVCQREFIGVKRGNIAQAVKMLKEAAYHGITGKVELFPSANAQQAFQKAKTSNYATQVVLQY